MIDLLEDDSVTSPQPLVIWTQGRLRIEVRSVDGMRAAVLTDDEGVVWGAWPLSSRAKPS
jgi:hypothetical protein